MVSLESPFNFESNGTYAQEFGGITYYKSTRSKITCFSVQKVSKKWKIEIFFDFYIAMNKIMFQKYNMTIFSLFY